MNKQLSDFIDDLENIKNGLNTTHQNLGLLCQQAYYHKHWFTTDEIIRRLNALSVFINSSTFSSIIEHIKPVQSKKVVAYYSDENIPLEEIMQIIFLTQAGYRVKYKSAQQADIIFKYLANLYQQYFPESIIVVDEQLSNFDYFIYASKNPPTETQRRIFQQFLYIEQVRYHSVAVVSNNYDSSDLNKLGNDVFSYFGMGCGNVRKIFVPQTFRINDFFVAIEPYNYLLQHHAYMNNYQYHQSVYLMNKISHSDNGFLLLKQDDSMRAPTGVLYFDTYSDEEKLRQKLSNHNQIYAVYVANPIYPKEISFGKSDEQLFLPSEPLKKLIT